jgi:hypothetical protein
VLMRKLSRAVAWWNGVSTVAQRRWCGGGKGAVALEVLGRRKSRVRVLGLRGGSFCRAAALPWRAGPGEGRSPGISGRCTPGRKKEREKKVLTRGTCLAERERGGGRASGKAELREDTAQVRPTREGGEGRGARPRVAHAGERRGEGPEGERGRGKGGGPG